MYYRYTICFLLCLLSIQNTNAQYSETQQKIYIEVKQFGQFVKRFNYREDFFGKPVDQEFKNNISRSEYIQLLFDETDPRTIENNNAYQALKEEFIHAVVSNNLEIHTCSEQLYAQLECSFQYKQQVVSVRLLLKQEIENEGFKWVLSRANSPIFPSIEKDSLQMAFIPPTNNELYFSKLKTVFRNKELIANYTKKDFQYDGLSTLLFLLKNEAITFRAVNKVTYMVFEISEWVVTVEEFNRNTYNSGWLISNLEKWNSTPEDYFNYHF